MVRRGSHAMFASSVLALLLVAPAILAWCLPWLDFLAELNRLTSPLLLPGAALSKFVTGSSWGDLAYTIFFDWLIYTFLSWPLMMALTSSS